jgi:dihydrofolate reductase
MGKLKAAAFSVSLDGFGAAPGQSIDNPFGVGGMVLPAWMLKTRYFHKMIGKEGGDTGIGDQLAHRSMENLGAWIMGRNMFGPVRGPWPDDTWKGWWGDEPPYRYPVFVVTHHPRDPVEMQGGTTYHFATDGIEAALEQAKEAAGGKDVMLYGGAQVVNEYLAAGLLDVLELHVAPLLLGGGARLFDGVGPAVKLEQVRAVEAPGVTHLKYAAVT